MPTRTRARRLNLRRVASPSPSPLQVHPGSSLPPRSLPPTSKDPPGPSNALHLHARTSMLRAQPGTRLKPLPHPRCSQQPSDSGRGPSKHRGGRPGKGQGAWRGLIHMQGTARRGGRQERTKAVPPPAAQCQAHPARSPGGPRRGPLCVCSAGRGCSVPTASGRRHPPSDPAHLISSGDLRATAPFSESPGQLRWPSLLEWGWTAQSLRQRPEF